MKRLGIIGMIALLVIALVVLNHSMNRNATPDPGEDADQQKSQPATPPKPGPAPTTGSLQEPALPSEEIVGDPAQAKSHIEVGWIYDANNQSRAAATLTLPLGTVREFVLSSHGTASAEIVNIDVPTEDRSPAARTVTNLGVTVNGKVVLSGNPSDLRLTPAQINSALTAATKA